jgi:DNA-directed RNA polymerase subunit RPC12/RpoP
MPHFTYALRGELRCFSCARYLGDFESHPETHGKGDVHVLLPEGGQPAAHAVETAQGLRCSRCGGRVVLDDVQKVPMALAA